MTAPHVTHFRTAQFLRQHALSQGLVVFPINFTGKEDRRSDVRWYGLRLKDDPKLEEAWVDGFTAKTVKFYLRISASELNRVSLLHATEGKTFFVGTIPNCLGRAVEILRAEDAAERLRG